MLLQSMPAAISSSKGSGIDPEFEPASSRGWRAGASAVAREEEGREVAGLEEVSSR